MDYSRRFGILAVGTQQGDFFVYDADIRGVVFRHKELSDRIVKVKCCEVVKNIYLFYERGSIKVIDAVSYRKI